jgi:hypothetical protein
MPPRPAPCLPAGKEITPIHPLPLFLRILSGGIFGVDKCRGRSRIKLAEGVGNEVKMVLIRGGFYKIEPPYYFLLFIKKRGE